MKVTRQDAGYRGPEYLVTLPGPFGGNVAAIYTTQDATVLAIQMLDAVYDLLKDNPYAKDSADLRTSVEELERLADAWPELDAEDVVPDADALLERDDDRAEAMQARYEMAGSPDPRDP